MAETMSIEDQPKLGRFQITLPLDLLARIDEARSKLRREGLRVSYSSFAEIAFEELLNHRDLASTMRKRGASARRS